MNVRSFLINNGMIMAHETPSNSEFRVECPTCHSPHKKCYVNATGKGTSCKNCQTNMSWRRFTRLFAPPTPQEQALESFTQATNDALMADPALITYWSDRGIEATTLTALRLGVCRASELYAPGPIDVEVGLAVETQPGIYKWYFDQRLTIPYLEDGIPQTIRGRDLPGIDSGRKYLSMKGAKALPYLPSAIDPTQPVVACEGEIDSILLRQNGIQSIGIPGAGNAQKEWFKDIRELYLALDGDDAGRAGAEKLLKSIPEVRRVDMPEGFDISDYVNTFGIDSFKQLIDKAVFYLHGKPQQNDKFSNIVDTFTDWAWSNGAIVGPRIAWAPRLEDILSGWSPGLILFGATAHSGKSCWLVKSLYSLVNENPDAIGVYLSLDDTLHESMLRLVSQHTGLDFNLIKSPRWNFDHPTDPNRQRPDLLKHFNDGIASLKQINNLIIRDATYGRSLTYLRSFFESLRATYPYKQITVFVDSLAKITNDGSDNKLDEEFGQASNWKAHVASELKYLTTKHKICLITPTDLRKLNGNRRPTTDDLKDAAELAYEAQVIIMGYNDLKISANQAVLTWVDPTTQEVMPILELNVVKNKFTGKIETIRYKMDGRTSDFWEATKQEEAFYDSLVAQQASQMRGYRPTP